MTPDILTTVNCHIFKTGRLKTGTDELEFLHHNTTKQLKA